MNLNQTPQKIVHGNIEAMALKGSKSGPQWGLTYKQMIIAIFIITLDVKILPPQFIYGFKAVKSLSRIDFPSLCCLSVNKKHSSDEIDSIKVLEKISIT